MRELPTSSRYWSEADGRKVIEAWRRSGEPAAVFARRHGLHVKRLKYWIERLPGRESTATALSLVPATVIAVEMTAVIRAGAVTVELTSATPDQVAAIASALARSTP